MRSSTATVVLVSTMLLTFLALLAAGRLVPVRTVDTGGYLLYGPLADSLAQPRNPLFGWVLFAVTFGSLDFALVPALQTAFFFLAAFALFRGLRGIDVSPGAALACTLPMVLSNLVLRWSNAVHPECLAVACLVLALAALLRVVACRRTGANLVAFGLALGTAYLLRPILLPAMVVLPAAFLLLGLYRRRARTAAAMLGLLLAGAAPFLACSTLRLVLVGDFNVVSFGGFQMSGLATQMLTPELTERLPEDVRPLARRILVRRAEAIAEGRVLPIPLNSRQQRSYLSVALGYFDYFARNYNYLLYHVNAGCREPGEGQVSFDRRMRRYAMAVVTRAPLEYGAWVVGATVRSVGRMTVTNVAFAAALVLLLLAYPVGLFRRRRTDPGLSDREAAAGRGLDGFAVFVVVFAYTLSAGLLMVLITSPESRYLETAGLLLPALPLLSSWHVLGRRPGD